MSSNVRAIKQRKPQTTEDGDDGPRNGAVRPEGPPDIAIRSSGTDATNPIVLPEDRDYVLVKLEGVALKALRFSDGAGKRLTSEYSCRVNVGAGLQNNGEVEYEITFEADGAEKTVSGKVRRR